MNSRLVSVDFVSGGTRQYSGCYFISSKDGVLTFSTTGGKSYSIPLRNVLVWSEEVE